VTRLTKVEPGFNHFALEENARKQEKLALQLTEYQRLPIGSEKRRSHSLGASRVGGGSPRALTSSQLGGGGGGGGGGGIGVGGGGGGGGNFAEFLDGSAASGSGGASALGGGMALSASGSFLGAGGLGGAGRGASAGGGFLLPGLSSALSFGGGTTPGAPGSAMTPSSFAQLGPSAAALLAQYGYGSVAAGVPAGGSAVPAALGPAAGAYPRVDASAWLQKAAPAP
jgi:hypothetical protein